MIQGIMKDIAQTFMGEGGYLTLVNLTNSDWHLKHYTYYQMKDWVFPTTIKAGDTIKIYIEWDQGMFRVASDDSAAALYKLSGTEKEFEIQARGGPFRLQVWYKTLKVLGKPTGSTDVLGWRHDGIITFVLSENEGCYTASIS